MPAASTAPIATGTGRPFGTDGGSAIRTAAAMAADGAATTIPPGGDGGTSVIPSLLSMPRGSSFSQEPNENWRSTTDRR
jgi:hypothetical protein